MSQDSIIVEPSQQQTTEQTPVAQVTTAPAKSALAEIKLPDDDSVDPTYRGKSAVELIEMHKNAASKLGQQGQELGVWRGMVAELSQAVTRQAPTTEPRQAPKITSDSLLTDPAKAISEVVRHELETALKPIKESRVTDQREAELAALNRDFPGYVQTGNDPEFQNWATGARGRSADAKAAAAGDLSAARRLLEAWEDRQSLAKSTQTTTDTGKPQGVAGARQATTEAGGSGRAQTGGKIFNRAEIVQMIIDKPEVYQSDAFQAELYQAAKEGRIR